jgi:hypothetical protein
MFAKTIECRKAKSAARVVRQRRRQVESTPEPTVWFSQRPGTHTQCGGCGLPVTVGWRGDIECGCCSYMRWFRW